MNVLPVIQIRAGTLPRGEIPIQSWPEGTVTLSSAIVVRVVTKAALQARFDALLERWLRETAHTSSFHETVGHPAYLEIIALGAAVVPLILRDLEREPKAWGPALQTITGATPVPREHAGRVRKIAEDWLHWAKDNGYVW